MACDVACQRNKQLKLLSSAMVTAAHNKGKDPEAYEKARAAYYTLKDGQGWLHQEKEHQANKKVQPILDSYQSKFDRMKQTIMNQVAQEQARRDVSNSQVGDEDEIRFVHSEIEKEKKNADVSRRLNELSGIPSTVYSWLPLFLDLLLGIFILYLVYQLAGNGKFTAMKNYFFGQSSDTIIR